MFLVSSGYFRILCLMIHLYHIIKQKKIQWKDPLNLLLERNTMILAFDTSIVSNNQPNVNVYQR